MGRGFFISFWLQIYKENSEKFSSGLPSESGCDVIVRYVLEKREHRGEDSSDDGFQIIIIHFYTAGRKRLLKG